jgi:hypothetical protein
MPQCALALVYSPEIQSFLKAMKRTRLSDKHGVPPRPARPFPEVPLDTAIGAARYRGPRRSLRAMQQAVLREARKRR